MISIKNYTNISGDIEKKIEKMLKTIPTGLIPRNGLPTIHLTNSLFHSYGIMYQKYQPSGEEEEEEFFDFCKRQNVWAFTCLQQINNGDTYLSIKERFNEKNEYFRSAEHSIFHEIGHLYYYQKGIGLSSIIDKEHETLSDIYANACILNMIKNHKEYDFFDKKRGKEIEGIVSKYSIKKNGYKILLSTGEKIFRDIGCL